MAESEVSRELTFTLKAGNEINVTVMFAAPPIRLLTSEYHLSLIENTEYLVGFVSLCI
jgi:hypothetical protein